MCEHAWVTEFVLFIVSVWVCVHLYVSLQVFSTFSCRIFSLCFCLPVCVCICCCLYILACIFVHAFYQCCVTPLTHPCWNHFLFEAFNHHTSGMGRGWYLDFKPIVILFSSHTHSLLSTQNSWKSPKMVYSQTAFLIWKSHESMLHRATVACHFCCFRKGKKWR